MPIKLKRNVASIDEVEDPYRPLYAEKDGKFTLDAEIEGLVPASKIDEMRTNNINDRKKFEADLEKYKDVDLDKYHDLLGREKDLEEGKLVKRGELDSIRTRAVEEAMKPVTKERQAWEQKERELKISVPSRL